MALSKKIAAFCENFKELEIPISVYDKATEGIIDGTGVGIAAKDYDFSKSIIKTLSQLSEKGDISIFGHKLRLSVRDSIVANSALIHGLDFDDTHIGSVTHCTASLWPTCYALGVSLGKNGNDILNAYILGYEIATRLGLQANGLLQSKGYHPTGVMGIFGCTVSACYLKESSGSQIENALGIALSMSSGNMQFIDEGAWNKRLHPGWAGLSAVFASSFAKNEFIGPKLAFEGRFGLFKTLLGDNFDNPHQIFDDLGVKWRILENAIKPYPACHFNHAFADCAIELYEQENFEFDDIEKIVAYIHPDQVSSVCEPLERKQNPQNHYEAQFSVPYIVASILVNGKFSLEQLEPQALKNKRVLEISKKTTYKETFDSEYPDYFSGWLAIYLKNGDLLEKKVRYNRGSVKNPIERKFVMKKYFNNIKNIIEPNQGKLIYSALEKLKDSDSLTELNNLFYE